jgi:hypothetical protein
MAAREIEELEDNLIEEAILYSILTDLEEEENKGKPRTKRHGGGAKGTIAAHLYLENLLNCGHRDRIKAAFRMSKETFIALKNWLVKNTELKASKHISVELKLAIFLFICSRPASQRDTMEQYPVGNRVVSE